VKLAALYVYPVKAARGVAVQSAEVEPTGLRGDRGFMVVDEHGVFLTQRQHPELARLGARLDDDTLTIQGDDGRPLTLRRDLTGPEVEVEIWGERARAYDCGGVAAGLLTNLTGRLARLVRLATPRSVDPDYARPGDVVSFADGFPLLVTTTASIARAAELATKPTDVRRYRPNLVIDCDEPFAEDAWHELTVGEVTLALVKPCSRCTVLDVDPDTGKRDGAVLARLAKARTIDGRVLLGMNAIPRSLGRLSLGDDVVAR
jgi:hypothetical protein